MSTGSTAIQVFRARWLVPVDGPPIENGAMAVRDGRIVEVGPAPRVRGHVIHDLGAVAILPGLINPHTHLELGAYAGLVPGPSLWDWLDGLVRLVLAEKSDRPFIDSVKAGAQASLAAGVTCVGDISRTGLNVRPLSESPIRKVCFLELITGARRPPNNGESLAKAVANAMALAQPAELVVGVSPHAPYSVSEPDMRAAADLATRTALPLTMHWLETRDERDWLMDGAGRVKEMLSARKSPVEAPSQLQCPSALLERTDILPCKPLLVHCNYLTPDEMGPLAKAHADVVWCPRTHAFFNHQPHPWKEMLSRGINVCIGTDSLASSPSLSILDELRFVRVNDASARADSLLESATIRAARALGLGSAIGTLEIGKCADFITIPCAQSVVGNPIETIIDGDAQVERTWINGRLVAGECA
jgi:cytosine/adenosine deaminase-related metal-dependent hydrolase